ncbi:MAG: hypothetical protein KC506_02360 [Nanoarchaeota archaeon]|nr:hypothetical protein [Nanoarchaeota archaeon]
MKKILGYILAVIGIVGIAIWAVPQLASPVKSFYQTIAGEDATLNLTYTLIAGIIIALLGTFFIIKGGRGRRSKITEVPIFRGKEVVGYRQH